MTFFVLFCDYVKTAIFVCVKTSVVVFGHDDDEVTEITRSFGGSPNFR